MVKRLCPFTWHLWAAAMLVSFSYLELRAFRGASHLTLSRQLARWLGCTPASRWRGPELFALGWATSGVLLAAHVALLEDDTAPASSLDASGPRRPGRLDIERSVTL